MPRVHRREPFDDVAWLYELKLDGFRTLAFAERDAVRRPRRVPPR